MLKDYCFLYFVKGNEALLLTNACLPLIGNCFNNEDITPDAS
jgi:hypothetical protein